jgi:hypothetical protein
METFPPKGLCQDFLSKNIMQKLILIILLLLFGCQSKERFTKSEFLELNYPFDLYATREGRKIEHTLAIDRMADNAIYAWYNPKAVYNAAMLLEPKLASAFHQCYKKTYNPRLGYYICDTLYEGKPQRISIEVVAEDPVVVKEEDWLYVLMSYRNTIYHDLTDGYTQKLEVENDDKLGSHLKRKSKLAFVLSTHLKGKMRHIKYTSQYRHKYVYSICDLCEVGQVFKPKVKQEIMIR